MRHLAIAMLLAGYALAQDAGTVTGRVVRRDGTAAAGVAIKVHGEALEACRTTDADGNFRVEGLPPGRYFVYPSDATATKAAAVSDEERLERALQAMQQDSRDQDLLAVAARMPGNPVSVEAGKTARFDIELRPMTAVAGRIFFDGSPVAGAEVEIRPHEESPLLPPAAARTDAEGRYRFASVEVGRQSVFCRLRGMTVHCGTRDVVEGDAAPAEFALGGRSARVRVLSAEEIPVTRATIVVHHADGDEEFLRWEKAEGPTGDYVVPYLDAGSWTVQVFDADGDLSASTDVAIEGEEGEPEAVVRMPAIGTLLVSVVEADDRPVAGAHIEMERLAEDAEEDAPAPDSGDTDAGGSLRKRLAPGKWRLVFCSEEEEPSIEPQEILLESGKTVTVVFRRPAAPPAEEETEAGQKPASETEPDSAEQE